MNDRIRHAGEYTVLDIGGTYMRWARWAPRTGVRSILRQRTPTWSRYPRATVEELRSMLVERLIEPVPPGAVAGVSFGAALDHRDGTVYASAPLWGSHAHPYDLIGALRSARPDVHWHVVNDVTAALLHFASLPRNRNHRKVCLVTISTGIACRITDRRSGEIPVDGCGLQGEIGHLPSTVEMAGEPVELRCDCGVAGHVAAYSSGPGIQRLAHVLAPRRSARWENSQLRTALNSGAAFEAALSTALDSGDEFARELLVLATQPIAGIVRTMLCLDPEIDLIGFAGGVAVGLGEHYRQALIHHLTTHGLYLTSDRAPQWVTDRIAICARGEGDCLAGAGLAAAAQHTQNTAVPS